MRLNDLEVEVGFDSATNSYRIISVAMVTSAQESQAGLPIKSRVHNLSLTTSSLSGREERMSSRTSELSVGIAITQDVFDEIQRDLRRSIQRWHDVRLARAGVIRGRVDVGLIQSELRGEPATEIELARAGRIR